MSASERLRALDGAMTPGPWVTGSKVGFPVSDVIALRNALPLIADCIDGIEGFQRESNWCVVCGEHADTHAKDCALLLLTEALDGSS